MRPTQTRQRNLLTALGQSIHERRIYLDMSQQQLADMAEVHRTYISDIERGARNLTVTTLNRICSALEIPSSRLFRSAESTAASIIARGRKN
jgi:transcriptional regulator with XRE-family HTH domain